MSETKQGVKAKRELPALGKADTLEMLASALNYMMQAGWRVRAGNGAGNVLVISIEGARIGNGSLEITSTELPASGGELPAHPITASTP